MNETNISPRQKSILNLINKSDGLLRSKIQLTVERSYKISKPTLIRDLNLLINRKLIRIEGKGKDTKYFPYSRNPLLRPFDLEQYFSIDPDSRVGTKKHFDFSLFSHLKNLFSKEDIERIGNNRKDFGLFFIAKNFS